MLNCFTTLTNQTKATPLMFITAENFSAWLDKQSAFTKNWIENQRFAAKPESFCIVPNEKGNIDKVLIGHLGQDDLSILGCLPTLLPQGIYRLEKFHELAALTWGLGAYQFTKYKKPKKTISQLALPESDNNHSILLAQLNAIYLVRDLINTPPDDMGPSQLADCAEKIAKKYHAEYHAITGDDLLKENYPAIHAVGRACNQKPRLINIRWGKTNAPKLTLVGKGVCFDTGGLNLKPTPSMALMKKDMGGAAHVLALAQLIMEAKLPVRLRVLIPAVENSVSGNAYHPSDVIKTRKGLTIEIGNTDAEGRLILADALAEAASENPDLLLDIATLTAAARIALGTDLAALFTTSDELANQIQTIGEKLQDPIWRMPLYKPYRKLLDSPIADMNNAPAAPFGGAINAALFLKEFIGETPWAHFDIMAWNVSNLPGRPEGGEANGLRAIFAYLQKRFTV